MFRQYDPRPIDGGWRVRTAELFHVDVLLMGFNYRMVLTPVDDPTGWVRGWCFTREDGLAATLLRAGTFDPDDPASEPEGWIKQPGTERRACGGYYPRVLDGHDRYRADCANCGDEKLSSAQW